MTDRPPSAPTPESLGVTDPTGLIALFLNQLHRVEQAILDKIEENASAGAARWRSHEREHQEWHEELVSVRKLLDNHLAVEAAKERAERERELVYDARVRPFVRLFATARREWRWIVLLGGVLVPQLGGIAEALGLR